jgi:RNA-directed DNA polymerase
MHSPSFYSALAKSILGGETSPKSIAGRLRTTLGQGWRWITPLATRYAKAFGPDARPRRKEVEAFLRGDEGLFLALQRHRNQIEIASWAVPITPMRPVDAAVSWKVPEIRSVGELAAWLNLSSDELEWFADLKRLGARPAEGKISSPLSHYSYRILDKKSGSVRLIEAPKSRLKELQKIILRELLEAIPTHTAAHGFVKGRSIKTFAAPHVGKRVVLRMDLKDFFPSLRGGQVQALFRTAGYAEPVADLLGGICSNAAPRRMWRELWGKVDPVQLGDLQSLYCWPHLPQGAPTSPALANLCAYRVDCRLDGLAKASSAVYTRYADDLAFSGDEAFERCADRFAIQAAAILNEEGFTVHPRKTRIMRQGVRQYLAGLVTNQRINVVRSDFDRLKAILTNCVRHGAESQNRDGHGCFRLHLEGRVGFVESVNAQKGARLRRIFERIEW